MYKLFFAPTEEIKKVRGAITDPLVLCQVLADIFRLNTLSMIEEAGSGHIGSSFSSMDIITWLWTQEMNEPNQIDRKDSDRYFSSKGHDVPALYSLLIGLERLNFNLIHKLRRLGGLPGHPDISIPNFITNTGSLGMGISKARGMVLADRLSGYKKRTYVLCGDGELQEGQIWESLQQTVNGNFSEITVIIDHNKIQSDTWVEKVSSLGDLESKFKSFGWEVARCDGHDYRRMKEIFSHFKTVKNKPQVLIADTVKGKGVSFMEKMPSESNGEFYKFHSGAPGQEKYLAAATELMNNIDQRLAGIGLEKINYETYEMPEKSGLQNCQKLVSAYGDELVKQAENNNSLVVLDADLMLDCGLGNFKNKFPERFFEFGIAEQDMVSVAGGLALAGKLPIVHSFACFLSTRPNEHIYNNASEKTKIIYVGTLAGILPATPGHSHQSVRDISILGSIPGLIMIEPSSEAETKKALDWAVNKNFNSTYLRLVSIPCNISYTTPDDYDLILGQGQKLFSGEKIAIIAYGPVMLSSAYGAAQKLAKEGVRISIYNFPWLNAVDEKWFYEEMMQYDSIVTIDDHYIKFGQGMMLTASLAKAEKKYKKIINLGIDDFPVCGQIGEVLQYYKLDADSIAGTIKNIL
jgi:transketolase